jgi:hypothetical protein
LTFRTRRKKRREAGQGRNTVKLALAVSSVFVCILVLICSHADFSVIKVHTDSIL